MSKASPNEAIPPVGGTGSTIVGAALFALVALLLGVTAVSAHHPGPDVAQPAMQASATRKTTTTEPVDATAPTASTTVPATAKPATIRSLPPPVTTTCDDALRYLAAHQAPGFTDQCADHSAFGHYGLSCSNVAGMCPDGAKIIHIACPAPFVYMNEAHNSWTLTGHSTGLDPYGQGSSSEQAFCNPHR